MKTAISLPDELFKRGERLARQMNISRSRLYAEALSEYLARRSQKAISEALDAVYEVESSTLDAGLEQAQHEILEDDDW